MLQIFKSNLCSVFGVLLVAAIMAANSSANAAAFMKYDGIDGESADENHKKWIDVLSVDLDPQLRGESGKQGAGSLRITKSPDKATRKLMKYCANGNHLKWAQVDITMPDGTVRYKFKDVVITSCSTTKSRDRTVQTEILSMGYSETSWDLIRQRAKR